MARETVVINTDTDIDKQLEQFRKRTKEESVVKVCLGEDHETGAEFVYQVDEQGREDFSLFKYTDESRSNQMAVFSLTYYSGKPEPQVSLLTFNNTEMEFYDYEDGQKAKGSSCLGACPVYSLSFKLSLPSSGKLPETINPDLTSGYFFKQIYNKDFSDPVLL